MIISDEPQLFEILEEYEESNNEDQFKEKIISITRPQGTFRFQMAYFSQILHIMAR
jgi:hypothetical protein